MLVEAILLVLVAALLIYLVTKENLPDNVPKGPGRIPFLGSYDYVFYLSDMRRLRDKYGDIFLMKVGNQYMAYLCNYQLIKEAFSTPHVVDRPYLYVMFFLADGAPSGVIFSNGERWSSIRRFLLRQLRDLGMGKSYMEDAILHEARKLVKDFGKLVGKPSHIPLSLDVSILNVVWQLVASKRYDYDGKKVLDLVELLHRAVEATGPLTLPDFFPILKYLPKFLRNYLLEENLIDEWKKVTNIFTKDDIDEHKANLDRENPRDVLDHYLIEMEEQKKNPDGPQFKSDMDLTTTVFDLFQAGSDTTSTTIRWFIYYVAALPEVQRKLHEEIDDVVDYGTEVSLNHRDSLPYLEATIHETHRYASFAMAALPHMASKDIQLGGYTIPKGTHVVPCVALCHEDPNYWKDPEKFLPERFIDENGKFKPQKESFMPFGIGRRQCIGESLARMELYLITAQLLQTFHFAPPEGCTIDLEPAQLPLAHYPKEQNLIITPRNLKPEQ